jgi:hypothetical protein
MMNHWSFRNLLDVSFTKTISTTERAISLPNRFLQMRTHLVPWRQREHASPILCRHSYSHISYLYMNKICTTLYTFGPKYNHHKAFAIFRSVDLPSPIFNDRVIIPTRNRTKILLTVYDSSRNYELKIKRRI